MTTVIFIHEVVAEKFEAAFVQSLNESSTMVLKFSEEANHAERLEFALKTEFRCVMILYSKDDIESYMALCRKYAATTLILYYKESTSC